MIITCHFIAIQILLPFQLIHILYYSIRVCYCFVHITVPKIQNFPFLQRAGKWNNLLIKSINVARYISFCKLWWAFFISFQMNIKNVIVAAILSTLLSDKKDIATLISKISNRNFYFYKNNNPYNSIDESFFFLLSNKIVHVKRKSSAILRIKT